MSQAAPIRLYLYHYVIGICPSYLSSAGEITLSKRSDSLARAFGQWPLWLRLLEWLARQQANR